MISNNFSKTCQLDIQTIHDLIKSFDNAREAVKLNGNFQPAQIKRIIKRNVQLLFSIFLDENKREALSKIEIISNESDFTRTIMPLNTFGAFTDIFRDFKRTYVQSCFVLVSQAVTSQFLEVPNLIKGLPSGIVSKIPTQDIEVPVSEEVIKGSAETQKTAENFEAFVNMNLDSMEVLELKKADDQVVIEIDSKFTKVILKNDLTTLETLMINDSLASSPLSGFRTKLSDLFDDGYKSLPGIDEKEMKSLQYMSKLYYSLAHQNYVNNGVSLPHVTPIFKYKAKEVTDDNIELAYDLLLFSLYIRGIRRRLEGKEQDALKNCSIFHLQLRCFIDPFIFSFIDGMTVDKLNTVILQRYKYYKDLSVFSKYERKLTDYNCPELTENDISTMINELSEKVIGKTPYICELHDGSRGQNSLRLPSENNFTLEQIINEIVPLEVAEKMGKDLKDDLVIEQIKKSYTITDEILNFFKKSNKPVKVKKESVVVKGNNLERVVKYFIDDVPEQYRDSFVKHIAEMGNVKFNFMTTFPLDEFGENIIRALYVWDPENDPQVTKNYKHLLKRISTEIMEKNQILSSIKEETIEADDGWGDIL
jgi:hypothetical protein